MILMISSRLVGRIVLMRYLKILLDTDLKIILLDDQNNYVGRSSWLLDCQNFLQHCSLCSSVLHNYFDKLQQNYFQICI